MKKNAFKLKTEAAVLLACILFGWPDSIAQTIITHDPILQSALQSSISQSTAQQTAKTEELIDLTTISFSEVNVLLAAQIEAAELRAIQLEEHLLRIGNPKDVIGIVGETESVLSIELGTDLLPSNLELENTSRTIDGSIVFNEDVSGLMEEIGNTFEDREGKIKPRDPDNYKSEAAMLQRIREYKRVRGIALERRQVLQEALVEALGVVRDSEDFATLEKQRTVIEILQSEIASSDRAVSIAAQDVEMLEREILNQRIVSSKAMNETVATPDSTVSEGGVPTPALTLPKMGLEELGVDRKLRWGPKKPN